MMKPLLFFTFISVLMGASSSNVTTCTGNDFIEYNSQYQIAYIAGALDTMELLNPTASKCLGTEIKMSQLSDTMVLFLKENPTKRHHHCIDLFEESLILKWNCKKLKKSR